MATTIKVNVRSKYGQKQVEAKVFINQDGIPMISFPYYLQIKKVTGACLIFDYLIVSGLPEYVKDDIQVIRRNGEIYCLIRRK